MGSEAAELIFSSHGKVLRLLADKTGRHYTGLTQAARFNKVALGTRLVRRCQHLDAALALLRHITGRSAATFFEEVEGALDSEEAKFSEGAGSDRMQSFNAKCERLVTKKQMAMEAIARALAPRPRGPPSQFFIGSELASTVGDVEMQEDDTFEGLGSGVLGVEDEATLYEVARGTGYVRDLSKSESCSHGQVHTKYLSGSCEASGTVHGLLEDANGSGYVRDLSKSENCSHAMHLLDFVEGDDEGECEANGESSGHVIEQQPSSSDESSSYEEKEATDKGKELHARIDQLVAADMRAWQQEAAAKFAAWQQVQKGVSLEDLLASIEDASV